MTPNHVWDIDDFVHAAEVTVQGLAAYVRESQDGAAPVIRRKPPGELAGRLGLARWIREGGMATESYREWLDAYLAESTRMHHPAYLAHQTAAPDFPAALADFVHGAINNPMAIYEMGAATATVEFEVLRWMLGKIGFPEGGGVLTHGGSLANLTALLAARAAAAPDAWTEGVPGDLALLAPPSAHYSITRAAAILGLGERAVVPLDVDELGRIDVARLGEGLDRARRAGRRPMALVAAACATGTGLYDDLRPIGEFCAEHGLWFHVDGAHGASALLTEEHRHLLDGVELADSVIWDAHKMLRTSGLAAAVLVRREGDLDAAFRQQASYLFYGDQGFDLIGRTVECTKGALGLKVFLNLAWRGERGLGEHVAGRYATAHRFWELARERPGFHCPYEPESNIVCFRYGDGDQAAIRETLLEEGSFHLTSAEVGGVRHLRVTVIAPATDDKTLESLLDRIASLGDA
ncbi:pyridoxal phosphate-dependent decarboxylase family protein [Microbispora bryophytorum]|uniref:Decarboxylase n=1 Tax=Microbispora bryophytorum TaxID=1460882 RepID=A0A8H9LF49_9ACTN|nr:pyridoxal-dependent decarboxylase [Microbispora bryophytorum]MBD3137510.1 diaminobutyrate decarboxylase [Microbispora bryophytorum]TQS05818.1 diaminobutyrate decarboxylase [Microbispora bryophytorum]GGO19453.1 decarboxylase [Microbispora bryophytorum]